MYNECQNIFIVEAVSLILLDKLTMKHNRQLNISTVVLIAQIIAELKLFQPIDSVNSF